MPAGWRDFGWGAGHKAWGKRPQVWSKRPSGFVGGRVLGLGHQPPSLEEMLTKRLTGVVPFCNFHLSVMAIPASQS